MVTLSSPVYAQVSTRPEATSQSEGALPLCVLSPPFFELTRRKGNSASRVHLFGRSARFVAGGARLVTSDHPCLFFSDQPKVGLLLVRLFGRPRRCTRRWGPFSLPGVAVLSILVVFFLLNFARRADPPIVCSVLPCYEQPQDGEW